MHKYMQTKLQLQHNTVNTILSHPVTASMSATVASLSGNGLAEAGAYAVRLRVSNLDLTPGTYVVRLNDTALGLASVSRYIAGIVEVMVYEANGLVYVPMLQPQLLEEFAMESSVQVETLYFVADFDNLAVGPWLRDRLLRVVALVDEGGYKGLARFKSLL